MIKYFDEEWPKEEEMLKIGLEQSKRHKRERIKKVFCIGNGESRKDFDIKLLKKHGNLYGCNAIYRDYADLIDVFIGVDLGIMHEMYHSGLAQKKDCYFRDWTKIPSNLYDSIVEGMLKKQNMNSLDDYSKVNENEKENSDEFVIHSSILNGVISNKNVNNSQVYISWIKKNDKSHDIRDCDPNLRDRGWSSGPGSAHIAINREQPDEIYLIGQDLQSDTGKVNNVYKSTKHYTSKDADFSQKALGSWIKQWADIMKSNKNIKFYRVTTDDKTTLTSQPISDLPDLINITKSQLLDKFK
tara:strand:- start:683 stop:1579 length:897 start_codon:yes stop_codon:yes gene_type:complete